MDIFPLCIEEIILDYKRDLEIAEKFEKVLEDLRVPRIYDMCERCGGYKSIYASCCSILCECGFNVFYNNIFFAED